MSTVDVLPGRVLPYGREAVLVELDHGEDVLRLQAALEQDPADGVIELVPAARTLLVRFDRRTTPEQITADLRTRRPVDVPPSAAGEVVVEVVYDGEDLAEVARETGLTEAEVVQRHQDPEYLVAFCGFAPGFAYLTGLDPVLHLPRRDTPRTRVPAGSVAIAGEYSAVYPGPSPGGWRLIGRSSLTVWDVERDPPNLLIPGTRVRFTAVDA